MLLRDDTGNIVFSACRYLSHCEDALESELLACMEGLDLALSHSELPIIVDTDCSQLVAMIKAPRPDRSVHTSIVAENKELVNRGRLCSFVKVDRGQVMVSHVLANFARTGQCTVSRLGSVPVLQELVLESDVFPAV